MPTQVNIDEIRNRISMINQQSAQINQQRQLNLGRKQQLESQLENLYNSYMQKYGVDLRTADITAELNKVVEEKTAECSKIEAVLSAIGSGDYAKANELLGIKPTEVSQPVETAQPTAQVAEPTITEQMANFSNEQTVATPPQAVSAPPQSTPVAAPTPTVAPPQTVAEPTVTPPPMVNNVADTPNVYEPSMDALAGFTKGGMMAGVSGLNVAPPSGGIAAPPTGGVSAPTQTVAGGVSFADLMGNSSF